MWRGSPASLSFEVSTSLPLVYYGVRGPPTPTAAGPDDVRTKRDNSWINGGGGSALRTGNKNYRGKTWHNEISNLQTRGQYDS